METNRNQKLLEISDGKLYGPNDMVKVGCHDCAGCSDCCRGMGDTILLDPFDLHRLSLGLGQNPEALLAGPVELHLEEGLVLPNLKMGDGDRCTFLNEEGRCSIHPHRPGICRLFPLGRNYELQEDGSYRLSYFLLTQECPVKNKTKMKVGKWLDTPQLKDYQRYLETWHRLTAQMREEVTADPENEEANRRTSMMFLQFFYLKPYESGDFFAEFFRRAALMLG